MADSSSGMKTSKDKKADSKVNQDNHEIQPLILSSNQSADTKQEADTTLGVNPGKKPTNAEVTRSESTRKVKRYILVYGNEGKANDVIYAPPLQKEYVHTDVESSTPDHDQDRVMVFFGGDIQDLPEAMEVSATQREHWEWNLENTAVLLQNQFPDRHILVIRPSFMQDKTYSCYDNFLPTLGFGNPEHTPYHGALSHLRRLLAEVSRRINQEHEDAVAVRDKVVITPVTTTDNGNKDLPHKFKSVNFGRGNISLVGFSKGCVVLNQFLYEFHYLKTLTPDDKTFEEFLSCLRDIYWLDGGHSGGKNTWITARSLLETLSRLKINVHVHVTPYQICDDLRPHIGREENLFSQSLKNSGAPIQRYVHFETVPSSLTNHFQLLAEFGSPAVSNTFESDDWEGEDGGKGVVIGTGQFVDDLTHPTDYNDNEEEDEPN